jgi:large subunit ribosomal protein L6
MSRIGNLPITIPSGVQVTLQGQTIVVKGPKGQLDYTFPPRITVKQDAGAIHVRRPTNSIPDKSQHGLVQRLISNMVKGVTQGFRKELEIVGVGYRAEVQGQTLVMQLGRSHEVRHAPPQGIKISAPRPTSVVIEGIDKQQVGQTAAEIRALRPPEPYKGKGIRYLNEHVRRKVGKKTI